MRVGVAVTLLAAAAMLGLLAAGGARAAKPTIYVNYAMSCTFTITDDSGRAVTSIPAGDYQILVRSPVSFGGVDLSGTYDMTACKGAASFQLTGPGVSLTSTMDDGDGDSDFLYATFAPSSTYTAVDTHQPTVARVTFATTTASLSGSTSAGTTTSATTTAELPPVVTRIVAAPPLIGLVSPAGKLTLKLKGKPVSNVPHGRYAVLVTDASGSAGFVIQAGGKPPKTITSPAFKGKSVARVILTKGLWFFYAKPGAKKTAFGVS